MPPQFLPICSLTEEPKQRYNAKNGFLKPLQTVDKPLCKIKWGLGRSPNASLRSFVGFASCKTSVRTLSSILAWSQGASLSALRLIFKSSAFEPPFSPWGRQARMPEGERPKRIRTMRHRAFTKRQGCLKVNAQSTLGQCATERSQRFRG